MDKNERIARKKDEVIALARRVVRAYVKWEEDDFRLELAHVVTELDKLESELAVPAINPAAVAGTDALGEK